MIDTIKLMLDKTMFTILDPDCFERGIANPARGYNTLVQNPKQRIYGPRLTITDRFNATGKRGKTLSIELSLPKLIHGNNFDELEESDFPHIISKLQAALKSMGIGVFENNLIRAPVSLVHYSKNIPLLNGATPHYYIGKLKQAGASQAVDIDEANYRNGGFGYKWHTSSFELAFYDKIHDLKRAKNQGEKRAEEKDNYVQLNLFEQFKKRKMFEVLRMEARLNHRQKIGQVLRQLGIETELTFQKLFSSKISQAVLLHYLVEIRRKRLPISDLRTDKPLPILSELRFNNPGMKLAKTFQILGVTWALSQNDPRELRAVLGNCGDRSWYRLIKEARLVKISTNKDPLALLENELLNFKPLKLVDFQDKLLNNDK